MYDKNNIFAKILRKEIPCESIYEDEKVLFFNDINPQAKIHILGIPKLEVRDFGDFVLKAADKEIKYFFSKVYKIVSEVGIEKTGYKILANSGTNGGQEVLHFHVHILGGEKLSHLR